MKDLELRLADRPGSLAAMARALGAAGVSLEGGGVFTSGGAGVAHFLVTDDAVDAATAALLAAAAGAVELCAVHEVVLARLRQDVPGQLGALCELLAESEVNVTTQYSDHEGRLVLVVDDPERAREVLTSWPA